MASDSSVSPGCPFLAAPAELQDAIARLLPPEDRQRLASTCSTFHHSAWARRWLTVVEADLPSFFDNNTQARAAVLAAWLVAHPHAEAHIGTWCPASILGALPAAQIAGLRVHDLELPPASGQASFSQLTRLQWSPGGARPADWSVLGALPQLQHLSYYQRPAWYGGRPTLQSSQLRCLGMLTCLTRLHMVADAHAGFNGAWGQALGGLTRLQHLSLDSCLAALPAGASKLAPSLTRLDLLGIRGGGWQHLAALRQLQHLELRNCIIAEVPAVISELGGLTRLEMQIESYPVSGWHHLQPLHRLQHLQLHWYWQSMLPGALSELRGLTHLDLSAGGWMGGWHHLEPLQRLQVLQLASCGLAKVPQALAALSSLAVLNLNGNKFVSAASFTHLAGMPSLRRVYVSECAFMEPCCRHDPFVGWLARWLPIGWVRDGWARDWLPAELAALRAQGVQVHAPSRPSPRS